MTRAFSVDDVPLFGHNLVGASAGTGKTYAIAMLFVRLLVEARLPATGILVVTFTEAATAELRDRIRGSIRQAFEVATGRATGEVDPLLERIVARGGDDAARRLSAALYDLDQAAISTIHGFCQRTLLEQAFQSDVTFNSELFGDARPLIDELVLDYWAERLATATPELVMYLRSQGFTTTAARSLSYTALRQPDCRVLPEVVAEVEPVSLERLWTVFEHVRSIWQHPDCKVLELIRSSKVNKRRYHPRNTLRWFEQVSELFAFPPRPLLTLPPAFERFRSEVLRQDGAGEVADAPVFLACEALYREHARASAFLEQQALAFKRGLIDFLRERLPLCTRRQNRLSFDDLLLRLREALEPPRGAALVANLRRRYPAALIDEFQDTDPVQYTIFDRIYRDSDASLFLIGDPKQAIYSFRGADIVTYLRAEAATSKARRHTLTVNHRSDPGLIAALNALFSRLSCPFLDREIPYAPVSARPGRDDRLRGPGGESLAGLEILLVDDQHPRPHKLDKSWHGTELPRLVASEIASLLSSGARIEERALGPGDIAVLTRTNDQAFEVQAALRAWNIPAVVLGDKTVYRSNEARELERLLLAVLEPSSAPLVKAALSTELLGVSAPEIAALDRDDGAWEAWLADFRAWNAIWSQVGFVQMFRALMTRRSIQQRLLRLPDGERRMTNLLHLAELLHSAAVRSHLGPTGLLSFLSQQRRREAFGVEADAEQIRLESDARAVKLTTMHKSKGLEYPVVYCPYLWSGMLRHPNDVSPRFHLPTGEIALDLGSAEREANEGLAEREQYAENLRLAYVALTRARHRCVVFWGRIGSFATSPLGYLLHPLPKSSLAFLDAAASNDAPVSSDALASSDAFPSSDGGASSSDPRGAATAEDAPSAADDAPDVLSDDGPDVLSMKEHLRRLSTDAMAAELEALASTTPIELRRLAARAPEPTPLPRAQGAPELEHRRPTARIDQRWRTSSFSALASGGAASRQAEDGLPDHDLEGVPQPPARARVASPLLLADFPRGATAGSFFHELFEHSDFTSPRPGPLPSLVADKLTAYGYPVAEWQERVCEAVWNVLDTPLGPDALRLADVPLTRRLNELEFYLPVASTARGAGSAVDARSLARVLFAHPSPELSPSYAAELAELDFVPLVGFLRGYIDLVLEHGGRYYVIDYKTNHLGDAAEDYGVEGVARAMSHGHYYLQYHLYSLAVHRLLAHRLSSYRYEEHFGGVLYLFIKGMQPELGQSGVFFEKPPLARLDALSKLLSLGAS